MAQIFEARRTRADDRGRGKTVSKISGEISRRSLFGLGIGRRIRFDGIVSWLLSFMFNGSTAEAVSQQNLAGFCAINGADDPPFFQ